MTTTLKNLAMPGNPRYQPKQLIPIFGYDNLYRTVGEVEFATLSTLGEIGVIEASLFNGLTDDIVTTLLDTITTTEVDHIEGTITQHDMRAWALRARQILDQYGLKDLGQWLHLPLTSFDPLHTGRILQYVRAWEKVLKPSCKKFLSILVDRVREFADTLQVGRTHGQHALPITVGFWLATLLERIRYNVVAVDERSRQLVGKISGAVGAYNAQDGLGFSARCLEKPPHLSFEERVLNKLSLKAAPISTQILPPEPLAYFLHAACLLSASLGQLGMDCRHLMRSEISEIAEPFAPGQAGSSTMAHKRNPIKFENIQSTWLKTKSEYGKVFDALNSEHQRDLVGSTLERDFPIILINVCGQLDTLLKEDKKGIPFLTRITVDTAACERNFQQNANVLLSEPLYIALIMGGYPYDSHELVNHTLTPYARSHGCSLIEACQSLDRGTDQGDKAIAALESLPTEIYDLFRHPKQYTGRAKEKALYIAEQTVASLAQL